MEDSPIGAEQMSTQDLPQLYLVTPTVLDLETYPAQLARILDSVDIACLRLGLASTDEDEIARTADALRDVAHARDIMLVIERHALMVDRLGLDGVHLMNSGRNLRQLRKDMGDDVILGAFCNTSRHEGISAGEAGADYVSFGPVAASTLGDGNQVDPELLSWWSEMIEVPVVVQEEEIPFSSERPRFAQPEDAQETAAPEKADFFGKKDTVASSDANAMAGDKKEIALSGDREMLEDIKVTNEKFNDGPDKGLSRIHI